jgi:hypothetical protein
MIDLDAGEPDLVGRALAAVDSAAAVGSKA